MSPAAIVAELGTIYASVDTAVHDDVTCETWWKRHADGRLEAIDPARIYVQSRLHEEDLPGESTMSPAGFPPLFACDPKMFPLSIYLRQPELDYARSGAEFNEAFSPTGLTRLAQERMNRRLDVKQIRQRRFHRMYARRATH